MRPPPVSVTIPNLFFEPLPGTESICDVICKPAQTSLESTFLNIDIGIDPLPFPGCPIRHLIPRCFVSLYTRGETCTLFETMQALVKVAGQVKILKRCAIVSRYPIPPRSV